MCLEYDKVESDKFKQENTGVVKAYKVVLAKPDKLVGIYWGYEYHVGENRSDREIQGVGEDYLDISFGLSPAQVNRGIHVFLRNYHAQKDLMWHHFNTSRRCTIIEVECCMDDFVGISEDGQAVFMKVTLTQEEYERAMEVSPCV